jgi:hypothetical protein
VIEVHVFDPYGFPRPAPRVSGDCTQAVHVNCHVLSKRHRVHWPMYVRFKIFVHIRCIGQPNVGTIPLTLAAMGWGKHIVDQKHEPVSLNDLLSIGRHLLGVLFITSLK